MNTDRRTLLKLMSTGMLAGAASTALPRLGFAQ